jgi:acetolactate synthase I/II/III large subunit
LLGQCSGGGVVCQLPFREEKRLGFALPTAIGAAIAAPDRKVLALTGDGSGMYAVQSLWTMAREGLDVTVVVFANRAYRILEAEFKNMGLGAPSEVAKAMLEIGNPDLDWCALARGHGVESAQVTDLQTFAAELRRGFAVQGPYLVEVVL